MRRPQIRTWRAKLFVLLLTVSVIPVGLLALWNHAIYRDTFQDAMLDSLQALARAKAQAVDQFMQNRRTEVERIGGILVPRVEDLLLVMPVREQGLPPLLDAEALTIPPQEAEEEASSPVGSDEEEIQEEPREDEEVPPSPLQASHALLDLKETLGLILWDQRQFEELLVLDPAGRVVASTHGEHEGYSAEDLDYFEHGRGATYLQPLFTSPITGKLTTVIATPIRDRSSRTVGVLAARLNLERFFHLVTEASGLGRTGETVVGRLRDQEVVFMAPTRHEPDAALTLRLGPEETRDQPIREAARGRSGRGRAIDYRGKSVLAAWEHVPTVDWGLVVKMDRAEALRPVRQGDLRLLLVVAILVIALVGIAAVASRAMVAPLKDLQRATERISRGDFDVELDIRSRDEIGDLADSFERMIAAIKFFRHEVGPEGEEDGGEEEA